MKKTIIVGGGISGLTCAVYLARAGHKVTLFEKNNEFGGLVSTIESNGFRFEAGVRALVNAGIILPMLKDLGIQLENVPNKVSIGIEDKIIHVGSKQDVQKYGDLLIGLYPESKKEIPEFIEQMKRFSGYMDVLYGVDNPLFKNLKDDREFLLKKLLPWLPKFIATLMKINKLNEPVERYVEKFIKTPSVRDIITQHFFKATPVFFALGYFAIYPEYFYPMGGVGKLADALKDKLLELKGELIPNTIIKEVDASRQYVVDENNNRSEYDHLVWAADLKTLYAIAKTEGLAGKVQAKVENFRRKLTDAKGSVSVYSLYLEVDLPLGFFGNISNGHFFYTPDKKGLGNIHTTELNELLENFNSKSKAEILSWLNRFLELNTFEISIPGLRDKNLVPEGKTGLIVSILAEYALFENIYNAGWYKELISEIDQKIIRVLSQSVYPGLNNKILNKFSITPISLKNRVGTSDGAIVGWSFERNIPAITQMQKVNQSVLTPLPNIYQAGQWTYSPAGVPMAVLTGKLAADKIGKSEL